MANQHETLLCHYRYDALDRLTSSELPNEPKHQRFYCKSRLATEIQGANRYSVFQHDDQLLAQQLSEGGSSDTTLLAADQQRSVLHTLNTNQPRRPIAYTPYGHRPAGNGLLCLLGFNGERPDMVTGWYLLGNGYRAFSPVLMRFISPDSFSPFNKGGYNLYTYCGGNPITRRDPNGHFFIKTTPSLINEIITTTSTTTTIISTSPRRILTSTKVTNTGAGGRFIKAVVDDKLLVTPLNDKKLKYTILNPTLKELSYSKITRSPFTNDLPLHFRNDLTDVHYTIDIVNLGNAAEARASFLRAVGNPISRQEAERQTLVEAIRGEVAGASLNTARALRTANRYRENGHNLI